MPRMRHITQGAGRRAEFGERRAEFGDDSAGGIAEGSRQ